MTDATVPTPAAGPDWLAVVRQKVEGLRFGVVQIIVHDAKIAQIERTERAPATFSSQPTCNGMSTRPLEIACRTPQPKPA